MEFYTFKSHNVVLQRYTTKKSATPVKLAGLDYISESISRSPYVLDTVKAKNNLEITLYGDKTFAQRYLSPNTGELFVDIANAQGVVFFKGELIEARWGKNMIMLVFAPLLRIRKTLGERRIYQRNCPYELYGDNCRAEKIGTSVQIKSVNSSRVVVVTKDMGNVNHQNKPNPFDIIETPSGRSVNIGLLSGGSLNVFDTERSWWITRASPTSATGSIVEFAIETFNPHNLVLTDVVTVSLGCRHDIDDCKLIFDNLKNFGGFGAMNKISPFEGGLEA